MATVLRPPTPSPEPPLPPSVDELQLQLNTASRQWCVEGDSAEVIAAFASCLNALVERARE